MKTGLVTTTTTTTMHWVARTPMVKKILTHKACTATVRATTPLRTMTRTTWTSQRMTTMVIWMRAEVSVYAAAVVVL